LLTRAPPPSHRTTPPPPRPPPPGQNIEDWRIIKVWYNGNFFDSAEQLAAEWSKPGSNLRANKMKYPSE